MPEPVVSEPSPWRLAAHSLVCPRCQGELTTSEGAWHCGRCGRVGGTTLGFIDFLAEVPTLEMAAGGRMDLRADEELARELHGVFRDRDFGGLCRLERELYARQEGRSGWSPRRRSTVERFERRITRVNAEGSEKGADALLAKVDCKLDELGWPAVVRGAALEAGGGQGLYVSALAARFEQVVFVDASLVNVLLAAKVVEEQGLRNVVCVRADVMALPFAAGTFDLVHQNGVVEHVSDPVAMVQEGIRVRRKTGYYVCVSPNRMSLAPEPHCGLPAYGFLPGRVRRPLIRMVRGLTYEEGATDPRSLGQLKGYVRAAGDGEELVTFFLPRHLPFTARQTRVRRLVRQALDTPGLGAVLDRVLNVVLLPVVPQHIAITRGRPTAS
jgi:SAM-dependent methyltransferase